MRITRGIIRVMVVAPLEPTGDGAVRDYDIDEEIDRRQPQKLLLCCPLTDQPFQDPVVHPKGTSFEREAAQECLGEACYPNRALKDYLDPNTDARAELHATTKKRGIFCCSITHELLRDPVIDPEGNTYERNAILAWIHQHGVSPITRTPLSVHQLYDNTSLLTVLLHEVQQADESINLEEIEEWKQAVSAIQQRGASPQRQAPGHPTLPPTNQGSAQQGEHLDEEVPEEDCLCKFLKSPLRCLAQMDEVVPKGLAFLFMLLFILAMVLGGVEVKF